MPKRLQRQRTAGWTLPPNTVCVTRPKRMACSWPGWGNPFIVEVHGTDEECVAKFIACYEHDVVYQTRLRRELAGKNVACWCKVGDPCHADVQLQWANRQETP